jgi:cytochrome c oxidase subunit 2
VPQLRVKRDAQPGATTELLLEPVREGRYEVACAQHCGLNHYKMRGTLDVLDDAAWERWAGEESARAATQSAARPSDGNWGWPLEATP